MESNFWKNLILAVIFFTVTPLTLATSAFSLVVLRQTQEEEASFLPNLIQVPRSGVKVYASLPSDFPSISQELTPSDARSEIVRGYLASYNSPLEPYSGLIVEAADKYGLDFRLTTAIAQKESNLCKIIPAGTHNCWGWGIHSEGTLGFASFDTAIEAVSKGLKEEYIDKGYLTPEEIMTKYTPLSNGSWAEGVYQFMNEMQ